MSDQTLRSLLNRAELRDDATLVLVSPHTQQEERYVLVDVPPPGSSMVQAAQRQVLRDVGLAAIVSELDRAANLLFLALNATVATELHPRVYQRQVDLGRLSSACGTTLKSIAGYSLDVSDRLVDAYSLLLQAKDEPRALSLMAECGAFAEKMASKCQKVLSMCEGMIQETIQDSATSETNVAHQVTKLQDLKSSQTQMRADLLQQEKIESEMAQLVESVKQDIAYNNKRIRKNKTLKVVKKFKAFFDNLGKGASGESPKLVPPAELTPDQMKTMAVAAKQQLLDEAKAHQKLKAAKQKEASSKVRPASNKNVETQMAQDTAKRNLEDAQKSDNQAKIGQAQSDYTKATKAHEVAAKALVHAKQAEKEAGQGTEEATKAMKQAQKALESARTKDYEAAGKTLQECRVKLLQLLYARENRRRDALGRMAALNSKLTSSQDELAREESLQASLEITAWAFGHIFASFSNAQEFWTKMAERCDRLASPEWSDDIRMEMEEQPNAEERIKYYTQDKDFVKAGVEYLVRWSVLGDLLVKQAADVRRVTRQVQTNLSKAPTRAEAKKRLPKLKAELDRQLAKEKELSGNRLCELEAEAGPGTTLT